MGFLAKLVNTEDKIESFKKRYNFPEDVQIRYASKDDLALLQCQDLVLPFIAIVKGGVRIPMHPFLIQFLNHYRLCPLQYVLNIFRIVMGTTVLNDKLDLNLTVHDIVYMYKIQKMGKMYTLVTHNSLRKLVTGLLDSSKGRDEDFLVITRNRCDPFFGCPLTPGKPSFHCCTFITFILSPDSLINLFALFFSFRQGVY